MLGVGLATLFGVALIGTCATAIVSTIGLQDELEELAAQSIRDCSSRGDEQRCHQTMGAVDEDHVHDFRRYTALLEQTHGNFVSLEAHGVCQGVSTERGSYREVTATVQWESKAQEVRFQWNKVGDRWELRTVADPEMAQSYCD